MSFVQLIEFKSSHPDELNDLISRWMTETKGTRTTTHAMVMSDRENPGTYVEIIEFPSYEAAMKNSNPPQTSKFAEQMRSLCDAPPVFHNLEVMRDDRL
jgi:quinol monooxygenase YgiN